MRSKIYQASLLLLGLSLLALVVACGADVGRVEVVPERVQPDSVEDDSEEAVTPSAPANPETQDAEPDAAAGAPQVTNEAQPPTNQNNESQVAADKPVVLLEEDFSGSIGSFHYAVSEVTFGTEEGDLSSLGTFAMVTNTGPTNPYTPMLEMQLFDAQGSMVGSGTGQILYIPHGETVPVAFYFEGDRPPFASYSIRGIDEGFVQYFEPVQAEVVPASFQQTPCTTYSITNTDSKVATELIVSQRYFDAEGTMIDLKSTAHRVVEPGASETGKCFHNLPNTILTVVAYHDPVNPRLDN